MSEEKRKRILEIIKQLTKNLDEVKELLPPNYKAWVENATYEISELQKLLND